MSLFTLRRELIRLSRALHTAERRALAAEGALAVERHLRDSERERHYRLILNMTDRFFTNQVKTYAVTPEVVDKVVEAQVVTPPMNELQRASREFFITNALNAGYTADEAERLYERDDAPQVSDYET